MVNPKDLSKGDLVKCLVSNNGNTEGKLYVVHQVGWSKWDQHYYADIQTDYINHYNEISPSNARNYEKAETRRQA